MTQHRPTIGVLGEPEEIIRAIRDGEVDAFVVTGPGGERIYSLRSADVLYRRMIEDMKEGAVALDASGLVVYSNSYFAGLMKTQPSEVIGNSIFSFVPAESRSFFEALARQTADGTSRQELALQATDGQLVPVLATMNRIDVEENEVFCLIIRDLTDEKRREELLTHSRRKDEFLAMLAHELRNPLAPIRYAVEILGLKAPLDPQLKWVTGVIDRQVTQMTRLVDDLLDISRIATGKIRLELGPVDVGAVAAHAVESVRPTITARKQELTISTPARPLRIRGDAARLSQVISNLLNNAAKFTPERGQILLAIEERAGWVHIAVRDTGVGIAADMLPKIFDLFTQCDSTQGRAQGGLGIGLTLVRTLVEMQGGSVEVTSAGLDMGSEFVVRMPLLAEAPDRDRSRQGTDEAARADAEALRILIVDDEVDSAESLMMLLRSDGHDVRVAHDGNSAVVEAAAFLPQLIFLDIGLPGMDGYETAGQLRRIPGLDKATLVALTGYGQDDDRRVSREAGIDRHCVKPIDRDSLTEVLASFAAR